MQVNVKRVQIEKRPENQVTSPLIMEPHHRQRQENLQFDENGIFSKKIFGNLYKCDCGELREEGWCEECGTRVIDPKRMPDFFIDLNCEVLVAYPDMQRAHRLPDGKWNRRIKPGVDELENIARYRSFVYLDKVVTREATVDEETGEVIRKEEAEIGPGYQVVSWLDEDGKPRDGDEWDQSRVLIGREALLHVGVDKEWIDEHLVDFLLVPHTCFRPMIITNGKPFITPLNDKYSKIIARVNAVHELQAVAKGRPLYLLSSYKVISDLYHDIINFLFNELQDAEYSILKSEIISHPISGAVRATVINRSDIHEDVMLIGDTLVETLYPYLYRRFRGNMEAINRYLVEKDIVLLTNRPPTINHASILGMRPRIASIYPLGHTDGTNGCLLHNEKWCKEREVKNPVPDGWAREGEEPSVEELNCGDVEWYGQGLEYDRNIGGADGIDTLGLRCVGVNLIMADAMGMDTDGDVILEIALYSDPAIAEAKTILPSQMYMNYANGTIRNHIIEDFIFAEQRKESKAAPGDPT